jgi:hypothetical protein
MASLAIIVSIIFLVVLLSGPICFVLSGFNFIPTWIVVLLSLFTIVCGFWFFLLPITGVRYIGILSVLLGAVALNNRLRK